MSKAERRLNVAGDPSPYPEDRAIGPVSAAGDAAVVQPAGPEEWAEQSGLKFSPLPMSRNVDRAV